MLPTHQWETTDKRCHKLIAFVWLLLYVSLKNILLIRTHNWLCRGVKSFFFCSAHKAFESGIVCIVLHLLWHGTSVLRSHLKNLSNLVIWPCAIGKWYWGPILFYTILPRLSAWSNLEDCLLKYIFINAYEKVKMLRVGKQEKTKLVTKMFLFHKTF